MALLDQLDCVGDNLPRFGRLMLAEICCGNFMLAQAANYFACCHKISVFICSRFFAVELGFRAAINCSIFLENLTENLNK